MGFCGTRRQRARWAVVASAAILVLSSHDASAQPRKKRPAPAATKEAAPHVTPEKARAAELFQKSADAYSHGDFATAISLLDEAYALDPQPVLVYNMARAHEGLGHVDASISLYERYLAEDPSPPDRGAIEQRLATLRKQKDDKARLERERLDVEERRLQQEQQHELLERRAREVQAARPTEPPRRRSLAPYVVAGVGAAALATGGVFGLFALDKQSAGRRAPSLLEATAARDEGRDLATVANVAFVAGGALVAAGAVWWWVDRPSKSAGSGALPRSRSVGVDVGPGSLLVRGTF